MEGNSRRRILPKRVLAVTGAAAILIGGAATGISAISKKIKEKQDNKVYSAELIADKSGRPINLFSDTSDVVAQIDSQSISNYEVILLDTYEENEQVYVAIINDEGEIVSGYMESRYIDREEMEEIDGLEVADDFNDLAIVAKEGTWVTPDKKDYRNNGNNVCLDVGTFVVAALPETSSENNDVWKKVIYTTKTVKKDGTELKDDYVYKVGYVKEDSLVYADFDKYQQEEMNVAVNVLRLRENPSTEAEIVDRMIKGQKVIHILTEPGLDDGEYRWLYVAYKDEEGNIKFGWSAEAELDENGNEIRYLEYSHPELIAMPSKDHYLNNLKDSNDSQIQPNDENNRITYVTKIVDTSSAKGIDLNMRQGPGTDYEKVGKIANGTVLYIPTENVNNPQENNNTKWINVTLDDGTTGWVSSTYLQDYSKGIYSSKMKYTSFLEGEFEGYVGIDVSTKSITVEKLETILKNQGVPNFGNPETAGTNAALSHNQKINFVYLRLDATTYGKFGFANDNAANREEVKAMADLCEKYQMPFGFYYYSQSLTDDTNKYAQNIGVSKVNEVKAEEDYIADRMNEMNYQNYKYCVLPFAYDVEWHVNLKDPSKSSQFNKVWQQYKKDNPNARKDFTQMKVNAMKSLQKRLGMDVILYTNQEMLSTVFDNTITDEVTIWAVDPNREHSEKLSIIPELDTTNDIKCRQIALDVPTYESNGVNKIGVIDWNFMNAEFFEEYVEPTGYLQLLEESEKTAEYYKVDGEYVLYSDVANDDRER